MATAEKISTALGVVIQGVEFQGVLDQNVYEEVYDALLDNLVIFFRDTNISRNSQAPPTFECYCQFYGESNLPFCACFFLSCLNSVAPG